MTRIRLVLASLALCCTVVAVQAAEPVADAASGARKPHPTARQMQERGAKFSACRKEALDRGLQGEALKEALLTCGQ